MLDNTSNQQTKFRTKTWKIEINYDACGTHNTNSEIKFKTSLLKSSLCDHSDEYIIVKGSISIATQAGDNPNNGDKEVVFINCVPFTDCISEINYTQIDNSKNIDVAILIYNLIEHNDITQNHQEVYGNTINTNQLPLMLALLLIIMLLITVLCLNFNKQQQVKQMLLMVEKMLK